MMLRKNEDKRYCRSNHIGAEQVQSRCRGAGAEVQVQRWCGGAE